MVLSDLLSFASQTSSVHGFPWYHRTNNRACKAFVFAFVLSICLVLPMLFVSQVMKAHIITALPFTGLRAKGKVGELERGFWAATFTGIWGARDFFLKGGWGI